MRPSGRALDQMRDIFIDTDVTMHAEGSCMIRCGNTHVLCTASLEERVPPFLPEPLQLGCGVRPQQASNRGGRRKSSV